MASLKTVVDDSLQREPPEMERQVELLTPDGGIHTLPRVHDYQPDRAAKLAMIRAGLSALNATEKQIAALMRDIESL